MLRPTMSHVKAGALSLHGKIVLVTGASSGIGHAIALRCVRAGADVAVTYRNNHKGTDRILAEARAMGRRAVNFRVDVAREEQIAELSRKLIEEYGRVDAWINNAGADVLTGEGATLDRREKLDLLLSVDLRGTILASWAAVALMKKQPQGGCVINMSWDRATQGLAGENPQLFSAERWSAGLQQVPRALGGPTHPGQRPGTRLDRDRLCRCGGAALQGAGQGVDPAQALGNSR